MTEPNIFHCCFAPEMNGLMKKNYSYSPEIRFGDIDAMGHVNNAVYLTFFEQARIHFFQVLADGKWDWNKHGILVAKNEINYVLPVFLTDKIDIRVSCTHVGNKSFTVTYEIYRGTELCAKGLSVLVCFNYMEKSSIAVPEIWREKLNAIMVESPKA